MTAFLTDSLPLLAAAPNGIKKLRELILELAVRGKLVPQDPSDEPASELLKRIAEEKARLVAEGKIKKTKLLEEIAAEEWPFILPAGWEWSRLGDVSAYIQRGKGPVYIDQSDFRVVSQRCVRWTGLDLQPARFIAPESLVKYESTRFLRSGDILWNSTGTGTIGRACVVENCSEDEQLVADSHVTVVRPTGLLPVFLLRWIQSPSVQSEIEGNASGTTNQIELNTSTVIAHLIPVPPIAEQLRIVAKVDALMVLCDRLEAQQADAESAHAQLVQALLDSLTQASDTTDFATNWQRLTAHFHTLFTTESSINAVKQTLLSLAADGRLVSSCVPADYPALSDVIDGDSLNGSSKKPQDSPSAVEILRISAGTGVSDFLTDEYEHKWADVTKAEIQKFLLVKDDLLACRFNGNLHYVGAFSLYCGNRDVPQIFPDKLIRFRADRSKASPHYLKYILNAAPARAQIESFCSTTVGNIGISAKNLKTIKLRLPSLEEQSNIVDLLDQLMALCDQLKNHLIQARQLNAQLASTLVERALSDKSQQTPAISDRQVARSLLAAEITHQLHGQRTFGQRKLQKLIYLAEHAARLAGIQGAYLRDAAGPHDRHLMNQVEGELQKHQWYERIERETVGHAYRPLSQAGQHRQTYSNTWSVAERATIEQVIELMRDWDTDRCEMTVTLYAAWNDFILEGHSVSDECIVDEVMHSWNDTKLRFGKNEWLAILTEMKKHKILIPTGFGTRTKGGMLSLPGFE